MRSQSGERDPTPGDLVEYRITPRSSSYSNEKELVECGTEDGMHFKEKTFWYTGERGGKLQKLGEVLAWGGEEVWATEHMTCRGQVKHGGKADRA